MESIKYLIYYNLFSDPPTVDTCPVSPNHAMWDMPGYLIGFQVCSIEKEERKH